MKNLLRTCLLVAGLAPLLVVAPPAAEAHGVCTFFATMTLSAGFGLPRITSNTAGFSMWATAGICSTGGINMTGTVTGACGYAGGTGTADGHHNFSLIWIGDAMVLTGGVTGELTAIEDPADSGSCTNRTARNFIVAGTVTM